MKARSVLLASAIVMGGVATACAGDPVSYDNRDTAAFSWAGAYVGGQVGRDRGTSHFNNPTIPGDIDADGFGGGIYAGYNFDLGSNVIVGLDGDITYNNANGRLEEDFGSIIVGTESRLRWSGAVRARAGYAFDRFLPYVAGGVAFGSVNNMGFFDIVGLSYDEASQRKTANGWTVGAGIDFAATDNLIIRLEYRHTDYGRKDFTAKNGLVDLTTGNRFQTNGVRLGIAYKF
ncbi:outer membrane protein [Agrobacterium sp. Azo12]|uniref:outer membrane protein n=1 Tax=Agrobacterium sp. Azo12 TaxID=3031129 RepID=UPI0023D81BF7|nr:outer membrane protein [Agrobacterium sp. Azo12]MDO5895812.1 porin family protein [Agrobacterium sp. Azo12]